MNMCSAKYSDLISRFPSEKAAVEKLYSLLSSAKPGESEFALSRLYDKAEPKSQQAFVRLIQILVECDVLEEIVRIESRYGSGGIQDFSSVDDIPNRLHDWRADRDIEVTPGDLHLIYRLLSQVSLNGD